MNIMSPQSQPQRVEDFGAIIEAANRKSPVFTVTAGRTGADALSRLFALAPNVNARHEAEPSFLQVMRRCQEDPNSAELFLKTVKIPSIARTREDIYVETSHHACKGFIEPMIALGLRFSLVFLRRPPREIALSLLNRSTVPLRTELGWLYLLQPGDPNALPLPPHTSMYSHYQLCFWYALEIERRQVRYKAICDKLGMPTFDIATAELRSAARYREMLDALELSSKVNVNAALAGHERVSSVFWNRNELARDWKFDFDAEEEQVWSAIAPYEPILRAEIINRYESA
jgi:hypothetical protein